jgi:hypothetical protein
VAEDQQKASAFPSAVVVSQATEVARIFSDNAHRQPPLSLRSNVFWHEISGVYVLMIKKTTQ